MLLKVCGGYDLSAEGNPHKVERLDDIVFKMPGKEGRKDHDVVIRLASFDPKAAMNKEALERGDNRLVFRGKMKNVNCRIEAYEQGIHVYRNGRRINVLNNRPGARFGNNDIHFGISIHFPGIVDNMIEQQPTRINSSLPTKFGTKLKLLTLMLRLELAENVFLGKICHERKWY